MSAKTTEAVVKRFLTDPRPQVLVLTGEWGVGKTYAWNKALRDFGAQASLRSYAYVSLFGVTSLGQLRTSIMLKSQEVAQAGKPLDILNLDDGWTKRFGAGAKQTLHRLTAVMGVSAVGKGVTLAMETLAPYAVRDTIVCFDDFERLKAVTPEEVLGLISELKEERGCKVVLIFNATELAKDAAIQSVYAAYKEKVIDLEVRYEPTSAEAFDLAFAADFPWREEVAKRVHALKITNIRILRKTRDMLAMILQALSGMHDNVFREAIATTVLLCWCVYAPQPGKPTLDDLPRWNRILMRLAFPQVAEATPEQDAWAQVMRDYGFTNVDEFDVAIAQVIDQGFVEGSDFESAANAADQAARAGALNEKFSEAWSMLRDSFDDNADEFATSLFEAAKASGTHLGMVNLDGAVVMLRSLGRGAQASELIEHYVAANAGIELAFNVERATIYAPIEDAEVRGRMAASHAALTRLPTLAESARFMFENGGYSPEHIQSLVRATVEEFEEYFIASRGTGHASLVRACLQAGAGADHDAIFAKASEALKRIAASSPLNALRVKRYGIQG